MIYDINLQDFNQQPQGQGKSNGLYLHHKPHFSFPLLHIDFRIQIEHCIAKVTQSILYDNPALSVVDAAYHFPIDPLAPLTSFQAQSGQFKAKGIVKQKKQALKQFKEKKKQGAIVAMAQIDQYSNDILKIKLGNLPPKKPIKIVLSFVQQLTVQANKFWVFSLTKQLRPRYYFNYYFQRNKKQKFQKFSWAFKINIQTCQRLTFSQSSTHKLKLIQKKQASASFEMLQKQVSNKDFKFLYAFQNMQQPRVVMDNQQKVGMLSFVPEFCNLQLQQAFKASAKLEQNGARGARGQFIFLIDRSKSMKGQFIQQAKEALILFLRSLPVGSYFNVISFGTFHKKMFHNSVLYNKQSLEKAIQQIKIFQANMKGTQIFMALDDVFKNLRKIYGQPRNVLILTDGSVKDVDQIIKHIKSQRDTRISCIGIGEGASRALVKNVALAGQGQYAFVTKSDQLKQIVIDILLKISSPVLQNFTMVFPEGILEEIIPNPENINCITKNQPVNFYFRLARPVTDSDFILLQMNNTFTGKIQKRSIKMSAVFNDDTVKKILSLRKINQLQYPIINDIVLQQRNFWMRGNYNINKQIIKQSVDAQILSIYTAWLAAIQNDQIKEYILYQKAKQKKIRPKTAKITKIQPKVLPKSKVKCNLRNDVSLSSSALRKNIFAQNRNHKRLNYSSQFKYEQVDKLCVKNTDRKRSTVQKNLCQKTSKKIQSSSNLRASSYKNYQDDRLQQILDLQEFSGQWLDLQVLDLIQFKHKADLKRLKIEIEIILTMLIVKYLKKYYSNRKELRGILRKAQQWLQLKPKHKLQTVTEYLCGIGLD